MTLAELRLSIRGKLDDTQYDQTTLDEAINFVHSKIFNDHRIRFMETSDDLFVSPGDIATDLPDDMQTILNLHVTSPLVYNILNKYMEYGDFMKAYPGYATYSPGEVYTWTDFGNAMRFAVPVAAATTITIDYLQRPSLLVNDTDVSDIPDQYKEMVVLGALYRAMKRNEDYGEAATENGDYSDLVTTFVRNEGRGGIKLGPTIMRTNRRGRGSYRADREF
jgi:hypothetical protein